MPTLNVSQRAVNRSGAPKLLIRTENNSLKFSANYAPREVNYSGFEGSYFEISRPDRKPILTRASSSLRKISMSIFVGSEDINESFDGDLNTLTELADSRVPIQIEYDPRTAGNWRITSLSFDSVHRRGDSNNEIIRATVSIEFTEIDSYTKTSVNIINTKRPKTYKTPAAMSMFAIARRFYGTTDIGIVKAIAKANGIIDLRHIPPGKKLKLP
jgi:hypothetical protein